MRIAITDVCTFIDLQELDLTIPFFLLDLEVHSTLDVLRALCPNQQQVLKAFTSVGKLQIHNLQEEDRLKIMTTPYPSSISEMDKTVLYIAKKHNALVLTSETTVRNFAKPNVIDNHGILWILDQLLDRKILTEQEANTKLKELFARNLIYQNNNKLMGEFKKRLGIWIN